MLFMAEIEKKFLSETELKPQLWWRYIDHIFFLQEDGEKKLKGFIKHLGEKHPFIKLTAECYQTLIKFLDDTFSLISAKVTKQPATADIYQCIHSSLSHLLHS